MLPTRPDDQHSPTVPTLPSDPTPEPTDPHRPADKAATGDAVDLEPPITSGPAGPFQPTEPAIPATRPSPAASRRAIVWLSIALVAVIAGTGLFLSGYAIGSLKATTPGTPADEQRAFQPFWDTYRAITQEYAGGPIDRKALIDGAIKGMVAALGDPFSAYLSPAELTQSLQGISGTFEGIGATTQVNRVTGQGACPTIGSGCSLVVVDTVQGAPADAAGLRPGDVISAVDGATVDGLTQDAVLNKIRGPKGTPVTLTIARGSQASFDLRIVRAVIVQKEVETRVYADGTIGYLKMTGFSEQAGIDLSTAVAADVAAGRRGLILDLRGNPGGFVTAAQKVASQFVPDGTTIFWQEDAAGKLTPTKAIAGGAATDPSTKLVVLIDGGSASASEIVAGALQDLGRAKLIGSTSYGKGTIQVWLQLADNNGGFRLTTAKWLTPDKRWIHKVGLTPDIPVTVPAAAPAGSDPVLDRALQELGVSAPTSRSAEPRKVAA